ncbi:PREDICTED: sialidase-3 [Chaetura pelagica]|uniref:sialidase-3 n=1 Tax=Chaetura pelagica TaxID=8897 RepID=UPI0005236296|nr:PREDICTED: sialidase-3 [Chaetura pelagica]
MTWGAFWGGIKQQGDGGKTLPTGSLLVFQRETLFRQESGITYRIPALLYLPPAATFLAFAEKRSSPRDEDAKYLVLRRGHPEPLSPPLWQWGPVEELSALVLPGHRTMNPCPLYDSTSGTIFLFCICVEGAKTEQRQILWGCNAALCWTIPSFPPSLPLSQNLTTGIPETRRRVALI